MIRDLGFEIDYAGGGRGTAAPRAALPLARSGSGGIPSMVRSIASIPGRREVNSLVGEDSLGRPRRGSTATAALRGNAALGLASRRWRAVGRGATPAPSWPWSERSLQPRGRVATPDASGGPPRPHRGAPRHARKAESRPLNEDLPERRSSSSCPAALDLVLPSPARTVCLRAERLVVALAGRRGDRRPGSLHQPPLDPSSLRPAAALGRREPSLCGSPRRLTCCRASARSATSMLSSLVPCPRAQQLLSSPPGLGFARPRLPARGAHAAGGTSVSAAHRMIVGACAFPAGAGSAPAPPRLVSCQGSAMSRAARGDPATRRKPCIVRQLAAARRRALPWSRGLIVSIRSGNDRARRRRACPARPPEMPSQAARTRRAGSGTGSSWHEVGLGVEALLRAVVGTTRSAPARRSRECARSR